MPHEDHLNYKNTNMTGILIAIGTGLTLCLLQFLLADTLRYYSMKIGTPATENPYGKEHAREFPKKVRFLRLPISSKLGKLKGVSAELTIKSVAGEPIDCAGRLHWQRQPRSGQSHPLKLHQDLRSELDVKDHMYEYHFAHNEPIDIHYGDTDKIDLLMKIEGLSYAITTVSRENHVQPGEYFLEVKVSAANISKSKTKTLKLKMGTDLEEFEILA